MVAVTAQVPLPIFIGSLLIATALTVFVFYILPKVRSSKKNQTTSSEAREGTFESMVEKSKRTDALKNPSVTREAETENRIRSNLPKFWTLPVVLGLITGLALIVLGSNSSGILLG